MKPYDFDYKAEIQKAIDSTGIHGIRMAMGMVHTDEAVKMLAVEYRRELFRLHQELGKILGVLDQEQEDAP